MYLRTATIAAIASVLTTGAAQCHKYVLISIRGTNEPQGPSIGFPGMINTTLDAIQDGTEYDVVYPASEDLSADVGSRDMNRYIQTGLSSCPQQQYGILGYSQGASAVAIGLHNLTNSNDTLAYNAIKAVVVIGNPGHVSGAMANVDEFGGKATQNYTGAFYLAGFGAVPDEYYADDKILDICHTGDSICAPTYPNASFLPYHVLYGSTPSVQKLGADFLIEKLGKIATHTTGSPTGTPAVSSTTALVLQTPFTGMAWSVGPSGIIAVFAGLMLLF